MRGVSVTLLRASQSGTDRYNDAVLSYTAMTVDNVIFAPGTTAEAVTSASDQVTVSATAYMPAGTAVSALDRIEYPVGELYEVTGDPLVFSSMASPGGPGIVTVRLRRIAGAEKAR